MKKMLWSENIMGSEVKGTGVGSWQQQFAAVWCPWVIGWIVHDVKALDTHTWPRYGPCSQGNHSLGGGNYLLLWVFSTTESWNSIISLERSNVVLRWSCPASCSHPVKMGVHKRKQVLPWSIAHSHHHHDAVMLPPFRCIFIQLFKRIWEDADNNNHWKPSDGGLSI